LFCARKAGCRNVGNFQKSRVLVVEDEPLIRLDITRLLKDAGYEIVGPFCTIEEALGSIIAEDLDAAILDFNLGNETAALIADALTTQGIPFMWLTGYSRDVIPERHRERPLVAKPFRDELVLANLVALQIAEAPLVAA
jgi:CheY-like chemotaxis protein